MADIDVVVEVQAGQAKAELADVQERVRRVSHAANEASEGGLGEMTEKFGHMGRSLGHISPELGHMARMTHALTLLANPVALTAVGIAAVALGIYKVIEMSREEEKLRYDLHMKEIADEVTGAAKALDKYYEALAKGETQAKALRLEALAAADGTYQAKKKEIDESIKHEEVEKKRLEGQIARTKERYKDMQNDVSQMESYQVAMGNLEPMYERVTKRIDEEKEALGRLAEDMGYSVKQTNAANKSEEDAVKAHEKREAALQKEYQAFIKMWDAERDKAAETVTRPLSSYDTGAHGVEDLAEKRRQEEYKRTAEAFASMASSMAGTVAQSILPAYAAWENAMASLTGAQKNSSALTIASIQPMIKAMLMGLGQRAVADGTFAMLHGGIDIAMGTATDNLDMVAGGIAEVEAGGAMTAFGLAIGGGGAMIRGGTGGGGTGGGTYGSKGGGGGSGPGGGNNGPAVNIQVTVIGTLDAQGAESLNRQLREAAMGRNLN